MQFSAEEAGTAGSLGFLAHVISSTEVPLNKQGRRLPRSKI